MNGELESLRDILIRRDGCSDEEADDLIAEAKKEVAGGADPEEVLADLFGLEPDYISDIMP